MERIPQTRRLATRGWSTRFRPHPISRPHSTVPKQSTLPTAVRLSPPPRPPCVSLSTTTTTTYFSPCGIGAVLVGLGPRVPHLGFATEGHVEAEVVACGCHGGIAAGNVRLYRRVARPVLGNHFRLHLVVHIEDESVARARVGGRLILVASIACDLPTPPPPPHPPFLSLST